MRPNQRAMIEQRSIDRTVRPDGGGVLLLEARSNETRVKPQANSRFVPSSSDESAASSAAPAPRDLDGAVIAGDFDMILAWARSSVGL